MTTKITSANVDNTIPSSTDVDGNNFNISLLGFKIAVNEGLTVFNLADGVVDEFNDESGTDESEGSNDLYDFATNVYNNFATKAISAGFAENTITEPDTSTSPTPQRHTFNSPAPGTLTARLWGGGGGTGQYYSSTGGGGGFAKADITIDGNLTYYVGASSASPFGGEPGPFLRGGAGGGAPNSPGGNGAGGGGLSMITTVAFPSLTESAPQDTPNIYIVAGGGGGAGFNNNSGRPDSAGGGSGGGTQGTAGGPHPSAPRSQTSNYVGNGGGGSQSQGGGGGTETAVYNGSFLRGGDGLVQGDRNMGGGGGGYYGGGAGGPGTERAGGGGSSYIGNPNLSSTSTSQSSSSEGAGVSDPTYSPIEYTTPGAINMNDGAPASSGGPYNGTASNPGAGGYVLITGTLGTGSNSASIVSNTFTATSEPSTARIVVFEENVDTPTLNTDIIARVSRDGGSTYSDATLSDAGYVTGSSGQRILTGTIDVSGQPTGTSMRWKLDLANNEIKVHGVSLQWG